MMKQEEADDNIDVNSLLWLSLYSDKYARKKKDKIHQKTRKILSFPFLPTKK